MSAYGIRFDNASFGRIIDGTRILPYLVKKIDMASYSYTDDTTSSQPGWITRSYDIDLSTIPPPGRSTIAFITLPDNGSDAYAFFTGTAVMYKSGATFTPPQIYIFAADYVEPSGVAWGMLVWNPDTGALVVDTGQRHLNLNQIVPGVSISTSHNDGAHYSNEVVSSVDMAADYPAKPAFCIPFFEYVAEWGVRFVGTGDEQDHFYHRRRGATIDSVMLRDQYATDSISPSSAYANSYVARSTGLSILVIDASIYD